MQVFLIAAGIVLVGALIVTSTPDVKKRARPVRLHSLNRVSEATFAQGVSNALYGTR